ncbi:MAG: DUF3800 domain-containing protein [Candidatus Methanoperedens sp.]|nr:DUF3800 domain-containing protein [Candidatus Methanoperedens sp.]
MYIYLDESGDLGFSSKASKYFVIAALLTKDSLRVEKCITKVRKERLPNKYKIIPELKYRNSDNIIRRRILQCIAKTDTNIACAVLRKRQVHENLRNKPNILYNYLCGSLIGNIFRKYHINSKVNITVDRSLTGINREAFDEYIGYRALMNKTEVFDLDYLEINHVDSVQNKCIQAVDFVVGAIARNYEHEDSSLYEIINGNVEIALDFFKGRIK